MHIPRHTRHPRSPSRQLLSCLHLHFRTHEPPPLFLLSPSFRTRVCSLIKRTSHSHANKATRRARSYASRERRREKPGLEERVVCSYRRHKEGTKSPVRSRNRTEAEERERAIAGKQLSARSRGEEEEEGGRNRRHNSHFSVPHLAHLNMHTRLHDY